MPGLRGSLGGRRGGLQPFFSGGLQYYQKIKALFGSSIVEYWTLDEPAGTSGAGSVKGQNGNNGTPTSMTFGATGIGDGKTAAIFNGTTGRIDVLSAGLTAVFPGLEGTILCWSQIPVAGTWTDASNDYGVWFMDTTAALGMGFNKNATSGRLQWVALTKYLSIDGFTQTGWFHHALTWSKSGNLVAAYYKATLRGSTTGPGDWTGKTLGTALIGTLNATPQYPFKGNQAHVVLLNRALTQPEILQAYTALKSPKRLVAIGDSVSGTAAAGLSCWPYKAFDLYGDGFNYFINHATSGHTIMANMDAQVTAAANDNANIIVVALGTNDDNSGNMTALQAEVEENLVELKASNPNAALYYMNVLPRWTDNTGATPVDKSNIRAAIAAACTAQSVTCWDTYTTPWIAASDTSDGMHPTNAGASKVATEVLARI